MNKPVIDQKLREKIVAARRAHLAQFGVEQPSGSTPQDLLRDLKSGRRIAVERGINSLNRAKGDPADRLIEFVCSTEGPKRDGNVVRAAGFRFNNFDKNPVAPWGHDYSELPCGRWVERSVERVNGVPALVMTACFATEDINPRAEQVYRAYLGGFLNAVSIGWEPIKYRELRGPKGEWLGGIEFLESDLLECSFVLVPADPDAIPRAVRSGVFTADEAASFARWAEIDRGAAYVLSHRDDESSPAAALARSVESEPADTGASSEPSGTTDAPPAGEPSAPQTASAPEPQTRAEKECPDCGAGVSGDAESCARCGYDFKAGKKKDSGEKASAPSGQLRRLTRKAQKRSELTDALDAEYDEVRALAYRFWEHIDRMGWDVDSMFFADKPTAEPYEASWAMECRNFLERTRKRCASLATSMDEALGRMGDALGSIPLAAGSGDASGDAAPILAAGGHPENVRAGKKQFSTSRLERLLAVEAGLVGARDTTEAQRALLREVLDEAIAEQREKEKGDGDNPEAEPSPEPKDKGEVDDQERAADPLLAEIEAMTSRAKKDDPMDEGDGEDPKKKGEGEKAAAAPPVTRVEDDPLLAELNTMIAGSEAVQTRMVADTVDGILAGLPGRE